jgi:cycloeucalenol cycloisomerase
MVFQWYETFTAVTYNIVCVGLALPLLLQPLLWPSVGVYISSPDSARPLLERYSFKANLWLAVYSFIGNYWYTHYFYSVLKAEYSMPAHRLNNVPIALYFATHFYFSTYHVASNAALRRIVTSYAPGPKRHILYVTFIFVFSYFTAFMETLTISSFPYYSFADRDMAYTVGSAFYGIYFLVSFPAFFAFDNEIDANNKGKDKSSLPVTAWDTFVASCGYGMMILTLLDFVRLYLDVPLVVGVIL